MKSLASAREKEENNFLINHREFRLKRLSLWFIIFIALFLSSSTYAAGEVERFTLENGLVLLIKEDHRLPLSSLFLCVLHGSAQEGKFAGSGISHFIEHMVFKGTAKRKVGDIFKEIESYGGRINAFTSRDYTAYSTTVPSDFYLPALGVLADMAGNAAFERGELQQEREVILNEIRLNRDSPERSAMRLLWQTAYTRHPYRYPILGEEERFKQLTRRQLLNLYQDAYAPNNMVLAVVGDVDTEDLLNTVKETFKDFKPKLAIAKEPQPEPEQKELRKQEVTFSDTLTYLLLGFHSVALTDRDLFALDVLAAILGEGKSSRLHKTVYSKRKLVYSIEATNYTPRDPGLFIVSSLLEEKNRKAALSLILKEINRVKKKKVSRRELKSAKNKIISDFIFANETLGQQAYELALNQALTQDFNFSKKYIQGIEQVSLKDLLRVADKYLNKNKLNIVALTPRDKTIIPSAPERLNKPLSIGVENLTKGQRLKGPIERFRLENGLTLLVKQNKDLPLVSIRAVFKGGLRAEDRHSNGLSNLVAEMLDKGTKTKDAQMIAQMIESKGARFSSFSGNNSFGFSLDLLSKDLDRLLELFADLIINPRFSRSELNKQKNKTLALIEKQKDDVFDSGRRLLKKTLFQNHPYGLLEIGSRESLKGLRRKDLINFHRRFCVGPNMVLAVFGDIETLDVLQKVKKHFVGIDPGQAPQINPAEEPSLKVKKSAYQSLAKQQTLLMLGFPGTTVSNPDRFTLELICRLLSQSSGELFIQIREQSGLAYTLGAYSVLGLDPGYLVIYVATTAQHVEEAKERIMTQLSIIRERPLSAEQLQQAKRALIASKMISRQTNAASALEIALDELYGLGYNYHRQYTQEINQISSADVKRCAEQYFNLESFVQIIIGS